MFLGGLGLTIEPEMMNQIIAVTVAGSGIIGMVFKDQPKKKEPVESE